MNKQELDEASYLRSGRTAELIAKLQDQKESPPILVQSPPAQPAPAHKVYERVCGLPNGSTIL